MSFSANHRADGLPAFRTNRTTPSIFNRPVRTNRPDPIALKKAALFEGVSPELMERLAHTMDRLKGHQS